MYLLASRAPHCCTSAIISHIQPTFLQLVSCRTHLPSSAVNISNMNSQNIVRTVRRRVKIIPSNLVTGQDINEHSSDPFQKLYSPRPRLALLSLNEICKKAYVQPIIRRQKAGLMRSLKTASTKIPLSVQAWPLSSSRTSVKHVRIARR